MWFENFEKEHRLTFPNTLLIRTCAKLQSLWKNKWTIDVTFKNFLIVNVLYMAFKTQLTNFKARIIIYLLYVNIMC